MSGTITVNTKFGTIYVDSLINEADGKIRIYDSRREYMGYLECETLYDTAAELNSTADKVLESFIEEMIACSSIEDLVTMIIGIDEYELITSSRIAVAKYLFEFEGQALPAKFERRWLRDVLDNEYVNVIGDYYIIISE